MAPWRRSVTDYFPGVNQRCKIASMQEPNNHSTETNPVGRFMVAVGAIIKLKGTNKILLVRRAKTQDWQPNEWEILYGRIDQFEDLPTGLKREVKEETGLTDLEIGPILTNWHIYRGSKSAYNEVIGLTFICETTQKNVTLSFEHSEYQWIEPEKAVELIKVDGIKKDVEEYLQTHP